MNRFSDFRPFWVAKMALLCLIFSSPMLAQLETRSTTGLPGEEPFQVVAADFNGDGKLDLAVTDNSFSVLLGNGDGTFQKPVNFSYSGLGVAVATADINGDGKPDLVIANEATGVSVFLGNGDGTFQTPILSPTTQKVSFIAVGDFNHDKKADLLVIDYNYVSVLIGNGDGTFQAPIDNGSFPVFPYAAALADFNNDGKLDVAVVGEQGSVGDLGVFLGNGDGTLQSPLIQHTNALPYSVTAGDFNKDGRMDVAVAEGEIGVFLGNGNGAFQPEVDYTADTGFVLAEDMNGNGNLDIVGLGVYELIGNGDGTFQSAQRFPAGKDAAWLAVADFNADNKPDVVVSDRTAGEIALLNTGVTSFSPSTRVTFPTQLINTSSSAIGVTLTNTGTTELSVSSIKVSGAFQQANTCGSSVGPGGHCEFSVTYSPSVPGWHQGLITIVDSASSKPQVIELGGMATALKISPMALSFGSVKVGSKSPPQQVTVSNEGNAAVTFKKISIGGADWRDFPETNNCGAQLSPGGSCTVDVTFQPTKKGARTADVYFDVVGGADPAPVRLTGTGS